MDRFIATDNWLDPSSIFKDPLSVRKDFPNLMLVGYLIFIFFVNNDFMCFNLR